MIFENRFHLASGLFFACQKDSLLCRNLLSTYENAHYSEATQQVNTKMDKPVIQRMYPALLWNDSTQIIENTYFMSSSDYGLLMKHHNTRSWCVGLPEYTVSKDSGLKRLLRKQWIYDGLEKNRLGKKVLPYYIWLSYDFLDMGILFFIKLKINKILKRNVKRKINQ